MNKQKYLNSPVFCPYCESDDLITEPCEFGEASISQEVTCNDCGEIWMDVYTLTDVIEITHK